MSPALEQRKFSEKLQLHSSKLSCLYLEIYACYNCLPLGTKLIRQVSAGPFAKSFLSLYLENYACDKGVPLGTKRIRLETAPPFTKNYPAYILKTTPATDESKLIHQDTAIPFAKRFLSIYLENYASFKLRVLQLNSA